MASNKQSKLSNKYSKALLRAFLTNAGITRGQVIPENKRNELKAMVLSLNEIAKAVAVDKETMMFFQNPTVLISKKEEVVSKVLENAKTEKLLSSFVMSVLRNSRFDCLPAMAVAFAADVASAISVLAVKVTTAREMSAAQKEDIAKLMASKSPKDLEFNWHIDSSLFGGVVLEYGGKRYDSSIAGRLENIRSQVKL